MERDKYLPTLTIFHAPTVTLLPARPFWVFQDIFTVISATSADTLTILESPRDSRAAVQHPNMPSLPPVFERKDKPENVPLNLRRAALDHKAVEAHLGRVSKQKEANFLQGPEPQDMPSPDPHLIARLHAWYIQPKLELASSKAAKDITLIDLDETTELRSDTPAPWDGLLDGSSDSNDDTDSDTTNSSSGSPETVLSLDNPPYEEPWELTNRVLMTSPGPPEEGILLPRNHLSDLSAAHTLLINKNYLIQSSHHPKFPPRDRPKRAGDFVFPPVTKGVAPLGPSPLRTSIEMSEWAELSTGDVFEDGFSWMGAARMETTDILEYNW